MTTIVNKPNGLIASVIGIYLLNMTTIENAWLVFDSWDGGIYLLNMTTIVNGELGTVVVSFGIYLLNMTTIVNNYFDI